MIYIKSYKLTIRYFCQQTIIITRSYFPTNKYAFIIIRFTRLLLSQKRYSVYAKIIVKNNTRTMPRYFSLRSAGNVTESVMPITSRDVTQIWNAEFAVGGSEMGDKRKYYDLNHFWEPTLSSAAMNKQKIEVICISYFIVRW